MQDSIYHTRSMLAGFDDDNEHFWSSADERECFQLRVPQRRWALGTSSLIFDFAVL